MPDPGWLGDAYPWIKAAHIVFVIFWMAGMFMLPRFFAYHVEAVADSPEELAWRSREQRLIRIIINPAMILTWLFGLMLTFHLGWDSGAWLPLKLALVLALSALHGLMVRWWKDFSKGRNRRSTRFFRLINEIPTLTTIVIVVLVVVKPF